jgi:peptidyl-prolyl cis-trans isomerase C
MKQRLIAGASALALAVILAAPSAQAQNIAVVNGKPVPKARADALLANVTKQAEARGQQLPPDIDKRIRDKLVQDEIFVQEAEKRGLATTPEYKTQMEMARATLLTQALMADVEKKTVITDAEIQAEYDNVKKQQSGTEYRARHILVESEDQAKSLIQQLKNGAKFEDLAKKNSKDPGSGENGGDLDFAAPSAYVPEFSQAMMSLKKGEFTQEPVKTQFGWHIIKLEDTRERQFPALADVKPQVKQKLVQERLEAFANSLKKNAKTDYKFEQ